MSGLLAHVDDPEPLRAQLSTEQDSVRALRAEVAARTTAGAPRVAPSRKQLRIAFLALVEELAELAPERGNAILRRALGDGGSWSRRRGCGGTAPGP